MCRRVELYWHTGTLLAVLWLAAIGRAGEQDSQAAETNNDLPQAIQPLVAASELAIHKAMDEKSSAGFVDIPLSDVAAYFSDRHKIPIHLDRRALVDAGIESTTLITAQFDNLTLRSILTLTLRDLDLTYVIKDEVLLITTRDEANQLVEPVVYDVLDLIDDERVEFRSGLDYDSLIEIITSQVVPTSWSESGGDAVPFDGMLIISQTQEGHRQIAQLLADLRNVRQARPPQPRPETNEDPAQVSLRVYKVNVPMLPAPLTAKPAEAAAPSSVDKLPGKETLHQFFGGGGWAEPKRASAGMVYVPDPHYLKAISDLITKTIEPESWQGVGGQGIIESLSANADGVGTLVVKHNGAVHAQIKALIKDIETSRSEFNVWHGGGFH